MTENNNVNTEKVQDYLNSLNNDQTVSEKKETTSHESIIDLKDELQELETKHNENKEETVVNAEELRDTSFDKLDEEEERELILSTKNVEVTQEDKEIYLRSILHDIPVELPIKLCDNQIIIHVRSRTTFEHQLIFAAVEKDIAEEIVAYDRINYHTQTQKYSALFMIHRINNKQFSNFTIDTKGQAISQDLINAQILIMRNIKTTLIDNLSQPKWMLLLNALRIFEAKMASMAAEIVNENFWKTED